MAYLIIKYSLTAALIVLVSELAKRFDRLGALISSLPLITVAAMIWLYVEQSPTEKIANHALYTFWYVIPTLPMFLVMPWLLHRGYNFWAALGACIVVTFLCFALTGGIARRWGIDLGI